MENVTYKFPEELNDIRNLLPELVSALEKGYKESLYAFVYVENLEQQAFHVSQTERLDQKFDRGIVLRIFAGNKNFEYGTNIFDKEILLKKAGELKKQALLYIKNNNIKNSYKPICWEDEDIVSLHPLIKSQLPKFLDSNTIVHFGTPYNPEYPLNFNIKNMAEYAREKREKILETANGYLPQAGVMLRQKVKTKIFIDRCKNMSQSLVSSLYYLYAISKKGITPRKVIGGLTGFELGKDIGEKEIKYLCEMAEKLDNAKHIIPDRYKIITGPGVTGVIAHEAFGHTQEGDTCRLNRSCAPGLKKQGTKIGNDMATIINNAAVFSMEKKSYGPNGSHFFDDEGQLSRAQTILEKGNLGTPMNDLISAQLGDINGKAPRQSNGKRESWRRALIPRQTNTYFTPGNKTRDELINMVDNGFIAEYAYGGMEDPKGMGLTAGTEYLQEIKNGKLTGKIFLGPKGGHVELSDPVPVLLNGIIAKSKVYDGYTGNPANQPVPINKWGGCGKYHKELVEAGCGGPWILWEGINCG